MPVVSRRDWMKTGFAAVAGATLTRWPFPGVPPRTRRDPDGVIRLHSNENPFGPSPAAREAMIAAFDLGCRYPTEHYNQLEKQIAEREGLTPQHVVLGAGSHEILRIAAMAHGLEGGEVLTAHPTFEGFGSYAESIGARVHLVPLNSELQVDLNEMDRRTTNAVRLVFVCNPNNPTGLPIPTPALRDFVQSVSRRTPVFVDEAYHEYVTDPGYASMVEQVRAGENVIVSRTFSKIYGLAGMRVGYALARPDLAARLRAHRTSHSISIVALHAALASYADDAFLQYSRTQNTEAMRFTENVLREAGYRVLPSNANFLFFHLNQPATAFAQAMQQRGLRVGRPFPPYLDWCRVSLSTMEDMQAFAAALKEEASVGGK